MRFIQAIQMLGIPTTLDDEGRRESFMFGGNVKIKDIEHKYLNLAEFRKGWLKVADLQVEMNTRGKDSCFVLRCTKFGFLRNEV